MNMKQLTTIFIAALLLAVTPAQAGKPAANSTTSKTITLIELNDLHAHLVPHKDVVNDGNGGTKVAMRGGLTRIATAVKQIRADNPNSVLMNIGDTYHGGPEAFFTIGNAIARPLNTLGIDVGVPGNWDFYYSPPMVRARYGQIDTNQFTDIFTVSIPGFGNDVEIIRPDFVNIAANLEDIMDIVFPQEFMPATHMITVDGVKVGFIGLTSDIVGDMHPMLEQGFDFARGITEHKDLVNEHAGNLRSQGADIVVVMSELGIHKTRELADVVNSGVDVFFTAHTHEVTYTAIESASGALVVEAGNDGYLGRMDITLETTTETTGKGKNKVTTTSTGIAAMDWQIIELDDSVAEDPDMKALVDAERAQFFAADVALIAPPPFFIQTLTMPLDTVIGHTDTLMDRKDALESTFNTGWTDILRDITGTQVAFTPGFRMGSTIAGTGYEYEDATFATGEVTLEDAFRFFPMLYAIATGESTGQHMRTVIEKSLAITFSSEAFNHRGGWNYGFSGLDMELDLAAGDGQRVQALRYSDTGVAVQPTDTITVTGCQRLPMEFAGTLCAYEGFTNVEAYTGIILPEGEQLTALDLFVDSFSSHTFNGSSSRISDASNTPMWPQTEFIQPLDGVGPGRPAEDGDDCGFFGMCNDDGGVGGGGFGGGSIFGFGL